MFHCRKQSSKFDLNNFYLLKNYENDSFKNFTTLKIMRYTQVSVQYC